MKVGINILLWTTQITEKHLPLLEKVKQAGYDGVELPLFEPSVDYCKKMAPKINNLGLEMTAITSMSPETNPVSPDAKIRKAAVEHLKGVIDSAAELGSPVIGGPFHSCFKEFTKKTPSLEEMKWSAGVMREAAEYAATHNIVLAPEGLNRFECYLINTSAQARELARLVDHPNFGYHFDTHHAHIEEKNSQDSIEKSAKEIRHVHISENDRGTPGKGQVNWEGIFAGLHNIGYDDWLVIEAFVSTIDDFSEHINVWRDFSPQDEIYQEGVRFIHEMWKQKAGLAA